MKLKQTLYAGLAAIALTGLAQTNTPPVQPRLVKCYECSQRTTEFTVDKVIERAGGLQLLSIGNGRTNETFIPRWVAVGVWDPRKRALDQHMQGHLQTYRQDEQGFGLIKDLPSGFKPQILQISLPYDNKYTEVHLPTNAQKVVIGQDRWRPWRKNLRTFDVVEYR